MATRKPLVNVSGATRQMDTAADTLACPLDTTATVGIGGPTVGYRNVPLTVRNAAYTFVAADSGKGVVHNDTTARSYTVNTGVHAAGDVLTVLNDTGTGAVTIVQGTSVTLYLAGTATTGSRTVGVRGLATIYFASATVAYVSGPGVT